MNSLATIGEYSLMKFTKSYGGSLITMIEVAEWNLLVNY